MGLNHICDPDGRHGRLVCRGHIMEIIEAPRLEQVPTIARGRMMRPQLQCHTSIGRQLGTLRMSICENSLKSIKSLRVHPRVVKPTYYIFESTRNVLTTTEKRPCCMHLAADSVKQTVKQSLRFISFKMPPLIRINVCTPGLEYAVELSIRDVSIRSCQQVADPLVLGTSRSASRAACRHRPA